MGKRRMEMEINVQQEQQQQQQRLELDDDLQQESRYLKEEEKKLDLQLFYIFKYRGREGLHRIYKLDTKETTFLKPSLTKGKKKKKKSSSCRSFSLTRSKSLKSSSGLTLPSRSFLALNRCNRCLRIKRHRIRRQSPAAAPAICPPQLHEHYFEFHCPGVGQGSLPEDMAITAMGSNIYLIGGTYWGYNPQKKFHQEERVLPRDIYLIDTAVQSPILTKIPECLNAGKSQPLAWSIRGKIYIMPHSFSHPRAHAMYPGEHFECFDPKSNTCTILISPPVGRLDLPESHSIRIQRGNTNYNWELPYLVKAHAVLGSTLVISLAEGGVYRFDTAEPDMGWNRIVLTLPPDFQLIPPVLGLNFLPLHHLFSASIKDDAVFCSARVEDNRGFLRNKFMMTSGDPYTCLFDNATLCDSTSQFVNIEISSVSEVKMRWWDFVKEGGNSKLTSIGDGLFLSAKVGLDGNPKEGKGNLHYAFEVFRVGEDHEAKSIWSDVFKAREDWLLESLYPEIFSCFVSKDGKFL